MNNGILNNNIKSYCSGPFGLESSLPVLMPSSTVDIPLMLGADQWYDPNYSAAMSFGTTSTSFRLFNRARFRSNSISNNLSSMPVGASLLGNRPILSSYNNIRVIESISSARTSFGTFASSDQSNSAFALDNTIIVVSSMSDGSVIWSGNGNSPGTSSYLIWNGNFFEFRILNFMAVEFVHPTIPYDFAVSSPQSLPPSIISYTASNVLGSKLYVNGKECLPSPNIDSDPLGTTSIRLNALMRSHTGPVGAIGFIGWMGDAIRFSRVLSNSERKSVELFLSNKYSIPLSS